LLTDKAAGCHGTEVKVASGVHVFQIGEVSPTFERPPLLSLFFVVVFPWSDFQPFSPSSPLNSLCPHDSLLFPLRGSLFPLRDKVFTISANGRYSVAKSRGVDRNLSCPNTSPFSSGANGFFFKPFFEASE